MPRPRLVDHVDGLVRQVAIINVLGGELDRGADGLDGVAHAMVRLITALESHQDAGGVIYARLDDVDLLEAARQCPIFLEDLGIFLIGG
ncbi:hypothetical protein D3C85_1616310 [compost metagenome]